MNPAKAVRAPPAVTDQTGRTEVKSWRRIWWSVMFCGPAHDPTRQSFHRRRYHAIPTQLLVYVLPVGGLGRGSHCRSIPSNLALQQTVPHCRLLKVCGYREEV
jgi:hypothetical protein